MKISSLQIVINKGEELGNPFIKIICLGIGHSLNKGSLLLEIKFWVNSR